MKLFNYIRGFRKGKEAHRLEKEAMQDSFLADAMDGYDSIGESQEKQIELLRKRVTVRVTRKKNNATRWSAVACLLIGLCVGTYFLLQQESLPKDTLIALEEFAPMIPVPEPAVPSAVEPAIPPVAKNAVPSAADTKSDLMAVKIATEEVTTVNYLPVEVTSDSVSTLKEVHGRVTDKNGAPLIGASVAVQGTNLGTVSDMDGKFKLAMYGGKKLVVDYIGYESVTLPVDSGKNMLIAMNDDQQTLEEVVVVGYSAQKKKSITGSVSALKTLGTPQPIIGWKAYRKYLKENLQRPTDAECKQAKGSVVLTFRVNKTGRPENITVKMSLCPSADKEAVNLIERGSNWTPEDNPVEVTVKF